MKFRFGNNLWPFRTAFIDINVCFQYDYYYQTTSPTSSLPEPETTEIKKELLDVDLQNFYPDTYIEESGSEENRCAFPELPRPKRPRRSKENNSVTQEISIPSATDSFAMFGLHLACKLRNYSSKTQAIVEHAINNILFAADMGQYDEINVENIPFPTFPISPLNNISSPSSSAGVANPTSNSGSVSSNVEDVTSNTLSSHCSR